MNNLLKNLQNKFLFKISWKLAFKIKKYWKMKMKMKRKKILNNHQIKLKKFIQIIQFPLKCKFEICKIEKQKNYQNQIKSNFLRFKIIPISFIIKDKTQFLFKMSQTKVSSLQEANRINVTIKRA